MKDSTVSVRVERELKEQAEEILKQLDISVSTLINSLYKQVVIKQGVPFDITLTPKPKVFDEYTKEEFDEMLKESFSQAERGELYSAKETFEELKEGLKS